MALSLGGRVRSRRARGINSLDNPARGVNLLCANEPVAQCGGPIKCVFVCERAPSCLSHSTLAVPQIRVTRSLVAAAISAAELRYLYAILAEMGPLCFRDEHPRRDCEASGEREIPGEQRSWQSKMGGQLWPSCSHRVLANCGKRKSLWRVALRKQARLNEMYLMVAVEAVEATAAAKGKAKAKAKAIARAVWKARSHSTQLARQRRIRFLLSRALISLHFALCPPPL